MQAVTTEQQPLVKHHILRCGERLIAAKGFVGVGLAEILAAETVVLVVSGEAKAEVLRRSLEELPHPQLPASWLQRHPRLSATEGWALERGGAFRGRYHVLGGVLSALDGVRPEDLNIDGLVARVAEGGIDEVVLAMNATLEGQTTAHYLAERLEQFPIRLTQLAHGVPVGGELDYLDDGTLAQALRARRPVG